MHNKPWFDECSKLTDQRKQAKLQWLQNPNQISEDNLQNLRHENRRTFKNKGREYLKDKAMSLKLIIKTKILKICIEAYVNLRNVTNLN
jgi:hypothetical protein